MKKNQVLRITAFALLMAVSIPALSNSATTDPVTAATSPKTEDVRAHQLIQRLKEIKTMDKSALSKEDKKELRKEVKSIRKEMREHHHYLYISVGAAIIIILLLVLIL
jgi:hypothetical protein